MVLANFMSSKVPSDDALDGDDSHDPPKVTQAVPSLHLPCMLFTSLNETPPSQAHAINERKIRFFVYFIVRCTQSQVFTHI